MKTEKEVCVSRTAPQLRACQVAVEELDEVWPVVEPLVQKALDNGTDDTTSLDILFALMRRKMYLFVAVDDTNSITLCMVVQLLRRQLHNVAHIVVLSGRGLQAARVFEEPFEIWCKENGAVAIEAFCRAAQVRLFRRYGYVPVYTKIRKLLVRSH